MKKLLLVSLCLLVLFTTQVFAQNRTITGTVTGKEDGLPIPGVSVRIKGTPTGTITNSDGNYSIKISSQNAVLVYSFIGSVTVERPVGEANRISVVLGSDSKQLTEVVVTALGIRTDKDKLTGSTSTIKGTDIQASGEVSAINGLESKASGVLVVSSGGDPGEGAYIQIRGQSTITGNLQPLFIVDGIPVSNSTLGTNVDGTSQQSRLGDINPADIESTTVLKGAAAAALYGTSAANGVILITTKKGKNSNGKVNITLSSTYSLDAINRSVPLQTEFGRGLNGIASNSTNYSWGDDIRTRSGGPNGDATTNVGAHAILPDGTLRYLVPNGTAADPHGGYNSTTVYDHSKDLFHNGHYFDNNLSISGGDDKTVYYVNAENMNQQGIYVAGTNYYRKAFKANVDRKFGDNFKLSTNVGYSNVFSDRTQQGSNTSGLFLGGLRTPADFNNAIYQGTYVAANGTETPNAELTFRNPIGSGSPGYDNPFWILNNVTSTTLVNRTFGSVEATVTAAKWLSFVERAGLDYYDDYRVDNYPAKTAAFPAGQLTEQTLAELQFNNDLIAKFNAQINNDITFNGILGLNYNNQTYTNVGATVGSFTLPGAPFNLGNSAGSARSPFNSNSLARTTAYYAQTSFGLYDQLFVDLTGREEQSSTYANSFFFPSAAIAWQFTKLKPFKDGKILSFGKLRLTYGEVGIQPPVYVNGTYYVPAGVAESYGSALDASSAVYGGGYQRSTQEGNANIKPEIKKEEEVGLDLRFFNDRVSLSGTYYHNRTTGAIFGVAVPATTGYTSEEANAAELTNNGLELDLGVNWYRSTSGDFSITTSANWAHNKNIVNSLSGTNQFGLAGFTAVVSSAVPGQPYGVFWGPGYAKDASGKYVLDANGFPTAAATSSVLGDPNPAWQGGITNSFRYKHFNFSFLIDHVQGGQIWNGTKAALETYGTSAATGNTVVAPTNLKTVDGTTIAAGSSFRGAIENFGAGNVALTQDWYTGLGGGFGAATGPQFFESGTRTRLRDVSLGYTITGDKFKEKTKLQSIEITASGRNLVLITKYSGIDPETNLSGPSNGRGIDYFNNPSTRSYFFTVKINY